MKAFSHSADAQAFFLTGGLALDVTWRVVLAQMPLTQLPLGTGESSYVTLGQTTYDCSTVPGYNLMAQRQRRLGRPILVNFLKSMTRLELRHNGSMQAVVPLSNANNAFYYIAWCMADERSSCGASVPRFVVHMIELTRLDPSLRNVNLDASVADTVGYGVHRDFVFVFNQHPAYSVFFADPTASAPRLAQQC